MSLFRIAFSLIAVSFIIHTHWPAFKQVVSPIKKNLDSRYDAISPSLEKGQGLVEYALILALVAIIVIAVLSLLGGQVEAVFGRVTCNLVAMGREWAYCAYDGADWLFYCEWSDEPNGQVLCDWSPGGQPSP